MTEREIVLWAPHEGPQTRFLLSLSYEVLYGGAAGGGKTDALLACLIEQTEHPEYRGLFLRKTYAALKEVIDRTRTMWTKLGARWNEGKMTWTFPSGAIIEFGYLEVWADTERYQGRQFNVVCYDELGQLAQERLWTFLMSRNRGVAKGVRNFMRASANPGGPGNGWIRRRFITPCKPDGTPIRIQDKFSDMSYERAFFQAFLEDNPTLMDADPQYAMRLNLLPDAQRRQLREGDWNAGDGTALDELNEHVHIIDKFAIPRHWFQFGAFDWGFSHPFSFGWFAVDEEGNVYLVDTVRGRKMQPHKIASRIVETVPVDQLDYIDAGHDCWAEMKARGENTPTIAEAFFQYGIYLRHANISRRAGLNNLRLYLQWKGVVATPHPEAPYDTARTVYSDGSPRFFILDTPNNRGTFESLQSMVTDPNDLEDALKRDADENGIGGDDDYDMVRYGLASRPIKARRPEGPLLSAWHPEVLQAEADYKRRSRSLPASERMGKLPPGAWEVV